MTFRSRGGFCGPELVCASHHVNKRSEPFEDSLHLQLRLTNSVGNLCFCAEQILHVVLGDAELGNEPRQGRCCSLMSFEIKSSHDRSFPKVGASSVPNCSVSGWANARSDSKSNLLLVQFL